MKIYTKTGDKGTTSLFGGKKVSKANIRIESYGTIDELNSYIGLLRDQECNQGRTAFLAGIQNDLFIIGSMLATEPGNDKVQIPVLKEEAIDKLEAEIDNMDAALPPMKNFILPGGAQSVSFCHIARCVCRRAERNVVLLNDHEPVEKTVMVYLNRLSDYLFVLARSMAREMDIEVIPWKAKS